MDSRVSRRQQLQEQKEREKQEKRSAHYEKNREKIIHNVLEAQKRSQEAKSRGGRSLRNWNVLLKEVTKKIR